LMVTAGCDYCRLASDVPHDAFAVIIGGGVAGTSVAYHLTKRNINQVVLLEKGKLASGTTFHSPGLVSASHPAHRYKPILAYSVDLYNRIGKETGENVDFSQTGTVRLATNDTRMEEFRRYVARDYFQTGDVCKTSLIDADEVKKLAPIIDVSKVRGALYTTGDGFINAQALTRALAKGAENGGATIVEQCPKFKIIPVANNEWLVQLEDGREIRTRNIVNAAGLWANEVAKLTNYDVPLVHIEHQYASIGPVPEVGHLENLPAIIDHDSTFYIRRFGDHLMFGGFEGRASGVTIHEEWRHKVPDGKISSLALYIKLEPHFERLDEAYKGACDLIPSLKGAPVDAKASAFTMTADGYPLVGPTSWKQNYWLQSAYFDGISSGGGIGKYLADWIVDGEPPSELFDTDANRFDRWVTRKFLNKKSRETYSMFYNWSYTNRSGGRPTERLSGVYARLAKEGGIFSFRNGWEVAETFSVENEPQLPAMIREYEMVTNKCGIIDLSWKGKIEVRGPDAEVFLDRILTNAVPPLGAITSGLMLTRRGNILAPLKVFHHDQFRTNFILLTDPERESRDLYWIQRAADEMKMKVEISAVGEYLASLALVGPYSRHVLQELTKSDVSDAGFPQRTTKLLRLNNVPAIAARTSTSTGQLSFEFFHNRADTLKLYDTMMKEGKNYGIVNFGQATLNMMRLEHGFKLWGRELTLDTNPYECGLGHLVDLSKKDFIGKASVLELSHKQWKRKQVLLQCDPLEEVHDWATVPKGMEVVRKHGAEERIGQITSGTYSVRLHRPLAYAWVNSDISLDDEVGYMSASLNFLQLTVDIGGMRIGARMLDGPPVPLPKN
uniref:Dimethylglycine dehydrogenase, mitochondrial (inferred by orthology to a human protein) n=1 Tax=Anisakis simplex TaxID=6269 RepID=A0A158PNQ2_ANISI